MNDLPAAQDAERSLLGVLLNENASTFCAEDTATRIARSVAAAHARGLHAPSDEEREKLRFAAVLYLVEHGDEDQRALGVEVLKSIRGPRP